MAAIWFNLQRKEGLAFTFSAVTLVGAVTFLFCVLYPYVMPNIDGRTPENSLTITNASSTPTR